MCFTKSVVVCSAIGEEMEATKVDAEAGAAVDGAVPVGGGAGVDEECLQPDTRLSSKFAPKVGGP